MTLRFMTVTTASTTADDCDYVFRSARRLEHFERERLGGITTVWSLPFDRMFYRWQNLTVGDDADAWVFEAKNGVAPTPAPHGPDAWDIVLDLRSDA